MNSIVSDQVFTDQSFVALHVYVNVTHLRCVEQGHSCRAGYQGPTAQAWTLLNRPDGSLVRKTHIVWQTPFPRGMSSTAGALPSKIAST